jgi:serine/threonine-protein kinase
MMAGGRQPGSGDTVAPSPFGARTLVDEEPTTLPHPKIKSDTITSTPTLVTGLEGELGPSDPALRYETKALLGEGGMGEVRQCHDQRVGRDVAMKVIRTTQGGRNDFRSRFLREARVQGQLEHPAVPPVYDLGDDAAGALYFTMRKVKGETLESVLERLTKEDPKALADFPRHRLLAIFQRVCLAAHYAHTKGVVHRDLKPANVMLGDFGEVYVLDWGLARILGKSATVAATTTAPTGGDVLIADSSGAHTEIGAILGTPGYMSPEQILGQHDEIDGRSDVYALGVMLFEILARSPLFPDDAAPADIFNKALVGIDARPSARSPHLDVPPELDAICVRATQPAPESRYASARELHDAVDRYLAGDRDVEQRRMLATSHVGRAQDAAKRALEAGGDEDRKLALREAGRALALDPDNDHAVSVLLELLTQTPKVVPEEVVRAVEQQERATGRRFYVVGGSILGFGALVVFVPILLGMGVRSPLFAWLVPGLWMLAALMHVVGWALAGRVRWPWTQPFVIAAVMSSALLFGPFVFVPAVAVAITAAFMATGARGWRYVAVVGACAAIVLPAALEWLHVLPPSYAIEAEGIRLLPRAVSFPQSAVTHVTLVASEVVSVLAVAYYVGRHRQRLVAAQLRNQLQMWHLKHLVPEEAKGALAPVSRDTTSAHLAAAVDRITKRPSE